MEDHRHVTSSPGTHPVLAALEAAHAGLDQAMTRDADGELRWMSAEGMTVAELQRAVELQAKLEGRVSGLRLHTVAAAESNGAAAEMAATDTAAWASAAAGRNRARSWGAVWLAKLLEGKYSHTRSALAEGSISEEHAAIIVRAAESAPDGVSAEELADCEERMVAKATYMNPRRLRRAVRRLLEPISKRLADKHEGEQLREEEREAESSTWMTLEDNFDGTYTGRFIIPELQAHILLKALEKLSSPRRSGKDRSGRPIEDPTLPGMGQSLNWNEAMGAAFLELLEHLPQHGHGRSGITMVVHVDEQDLRERVGAATLESGARISIAEALRLACEAGQMPMTMGGKSIDLYLGSSTRLFSSGQAIALSALHDSCAAEGCERPFAWCELHHLVPWSHGGPTDIDNAVPLCGYHHRRIHDDKYLHERLPDGTIRFRHRWPSRRWPEPTTQATAA